MDEHLDGLRGIEPENNSFTNRGQPCRPNPSSGNMVRCEYVNYISILCICKEEEVNRLLYSRRD